VNVLAVRDARKSFGARISGGLLALDVVDA
jgi:hypothetical protein